MGEISLSAACSWRRVWLGLLELCADEETTPTCSSLCHAWRCQSKHGPHILAPPSGLQWIEDRLQVPACNQWQGDGSNRWCANDRNLCKHQTRYRQDPPDANNNSLSCLSADACMPCAQTSTAGRPQST